MKKIAKKLLDGLLITLYLLFMLSAVTVLFEGPHELHTISISVVILFASVYLIGDKLGGERK